MCDFGIDLATGEEERPRRFPMHDPMYKSHKGGPSVAIYGYQVLVDLVSELGWKTE